MKVQFICSRNQKTGIRHFPFQLLHRACLYWCKKTQSNIPFTLMVKNGFYTNRQKKWYPISYSIAVNHRRNPGKLQSTPTMPEWWEDSAGITKSKNEQLPKVKADLCGLRNDLPFQIAWHTFVTTVTPTKGVPIESVSKILKPKLLHTTQHYAKVLAKKISDDLRVLKQKLIAILPQIKVVINLVWHISVNEKSVVDSVMALCRFFKLYKCPSGWIIQIEQFPCSFCQPESYGCRFQ